MLPDTLKYCLGSPCRVGATARRQGARPLANTSMVQHRAPLSWRSSHRHICLDGHLDLATLQLCITVTDTEVELSPFSIWEKQGSERLPKFTQVTNKVTNNCRRHWTLDRPWGLASSNSSRTGTPNLHAHCLPVSVWVGGGMEDGGTEMDRLWMNRWLGRDG